MPATAQGALGSLVSLWRYPVKSMMGEELNAAEVTERGVVSDRAYALVDRSTGKVASAKNPRKWGKLFDFRATFVEFPHLDEKIPPVRITLPDGSILRTAAQYTQRVETQGQVLAALVGVYASVTRGGTIRRGDTVKLD